MTNPISIPMINPPRFAKLSSCCKIVTATLMNITSMAIKRSRPYKKQKDELFLLEY
jgi:hypothetical protein